MNHDCLKLIIIIEPISLTPNKQFKSTLKTVLKIGIAVLETSVNKHIGQALIFGYIV